MAIISGNIYLYCYCYYCYCCYHCYCCYYYLIASIRQSWAAIKLTDKTLCMTAIQNYSLHYNVHSLYGHTEAIVTMTLVILGKLAGIRL